MSKKLKLHNSCAVHHSVDVEWIIDGDYVHFDFEINNYIPNQNIDFGSDYKENQGLWDFDVVEVFIKREDSSEYLEVQSSPLNQPFALNIELPREKFYVPEILDLAVSNFTLNNTWKSTITIGLNSIPGNSNKLIGNCFSCLGSAEQREYFALNINTESKPDFHRPELFIELGEIK